MASGRDFPFTIMDIADLLRLNIRRRGGSRVVYADCPICGDRRGKLGLYPQIDTWRCYHCGECGGMLALYGKSHGISNSDAYQEICDALMVGTPGREYTPKVKAEPTPDVPQPQRASPQESHKTLTALLALLTLSPAHREHLRTKRGLTDGEIARFGFKSTPPAYQCRAIAAQLMNGTEEIVEAEDMDKYCNSNVSRGASKVHQLAVKNGLQCRRLVWNPNYKGIDDWLLALRRKETKEKEREHMNFKEMYLNGMCPFGYIDSCADQWRSRPNIGVSAEKFLGLTYEEYQMYLQMEPGASLKECLDGQRSTQRFRVYQLDIKGIELYSFAFRGIEFMHKAGYEQPPADSYQLVYDGELVYPREWMEGAVLKRIYEHCNDYLPEGFQGHSLSMSDIVELYDGDNRDFFYCDEDGFTPVRFDANQAATMREADGDE